MPILKRFKLDGLANLAWETWKRDRPSVISVDTETTGLMWKDTPFCITVAWENEAHYIELDDFVREMIAVEILRGTPTWVFHNSKFDLEMLIKAGIIDRKQVVSTRFHDTECLAHLLDENRRKGLKSLAEVILSETTDETKVIAAAFRKAKLKKSDGYYLLPREVIVPYARRDAEFTFRLYQNFYPRLQASANLASLYENECKLTLVLLDMESAGMAVDREYVDRTVKEYGRRILETEDSIRSLVGGEGEDFNPNSTQQVAKAFATRGINLPNVQAKTLKALDDPLATLILQLKKDTKLRSTYLLAMKEETGADGILHPNIRQHGTKTGRMSSGKNTDE